MSILSYNQINELFNQIAISHYQIKRFGSGELSEADINKFISENQEYPVLWMTPVSVTTNSNVLLYNLNLLVFDLVNKDKNNEQEVLSDCLQIALDVVRILRYGNQEFNIITDPNISPFAGRYSDWVAGWSLELELEVDIQSNNCDIPYEGLNLTQVLQTFVAESEPGFQCIDLEGCELIINLQDDVSTALNNTIISGTYNSGTTNLTLFTLDGDEIIITGITSGGGSGVTPNLQQVTDVGNITTNDIGFGSGVGIEFITNSARLREGTIDAGTGGNKGIAQICAVGYELKWEAGSQYVMDGNGLLIREVNHKFNLTPTITDDFSKGFLIDSRWILDNGDLWICTDNTIGAAVWELQYPDTYVTAFTYNDSNILTIEQNNSQPTLSLLINQVTGWTSTGDVNISGNTNVNGYVQFYTASTATSNVARLTWNDTDGTLDLGLKGGNVTLQIGQEQIVRVVNKTGSNLLESNYQAVRISGAQGNRIKVDLAQANNDANSTETIGLVTENINNNQEGFITILGLVRGINTTGSLQSESWVDGDILYLSPTIAGSVTNIKPVAPQHTVTIGYVVQSNPSNGSIFVKVDSGYELDELHNVSVSGVTDGQVLAYSASTQLWVPLSLNLSNKFDKSGGTITGNVIINSGLTANTIITTTRPSGDNTLNVATTEFVTSSLSNVMKEVRAWVNTDGASVLYIESIDRLYIHQSLQAITRCINTLTGELVGTIAFAANPSGGFLNYIDSVNEVWVTSSATNVISRISTSGNGATVIGTFVSSGGTFGNKGVKYSNTKYVIPHQFGNIVQFYNPSLANPNLSGTSSVAAYAACVNLNTASTHYDRVVVTTLSGVIRMINPNTYATIATTNSGFTLANAQSILYIDSIDRYVIADTNNNRLVWLKPGTATRFDLDAYTYGILLPADIKYDSVSNVLVVSTSSLNSNRLQIVSVPSKSVVRSLTLPGPISNGVSWISIGTTGKKAYYTPSTSTGGVTLRLSTEIIYA